MIARNLGVTETLQTEVSAVIAIVFILITQLGSLPFLLAASAVVFWFVARREGLILLGATLAAGALTSVLKAVFMLPRPPASSHLIGASGFGFPSGHAIAVTIVWGLSALILPIGTKRTRVIVAVCVIGLVGLSRLVLGVHYLGDVLVGILVGLAYLFILTRWRPMTSGHALGLSVVLSGLAIVVAATGDAFAFFGAALSSYLMWRRVPATQVSVARIDFAIIGVGGVIMALVGVSYFFWPSRPLALIVGITLGAGIIGLPTLINRVKHSTPTV